MSAATNATPVMVVVLNGTSSSGKSSIARALQTMLDDTFLTFGVDTLIAAMPIVHDYVPRGITIEPGGRIVVGEEFRRAEVAWYAGLAAIAQRGTGVIVDDVFLNGAASQARVRDAFDGLDVLWVGVDCALAVAAAREAKRDDREPGQAAHQASLVHAGVHYDLRVDTTSTTPDQCARVIADRLQAHGVRGRA